MANWWEIDWNPFHSPTFRDIVPYAEDAIILSWGFMDPIDSSILAHQMAEWNKEYDIKGTFLIPDLDPYHSPTYTNVVVPTVKLVDTAALTVVGGIVGSYFGGSEGMAVGAGAGAAAGGWLADWGQAQLGIPNSESSYSKYAGYIGALLGFTYIAYASSKADEPAAADTTTADTTTADTTSPPGSGAGPGYPGSGPSTTDTLTGYGKDVVGYAKIVKEALGKASAYIPKTAKTSTAAATPGATAAAGTAGAAPPASPVGSYALIAGAAFLAWKLR